MRTTHIMSRYASENNIEYQQFFIGTNHTEIAKHMHAGAPLHKGMKLKQANRETIKTREHMEKNEFPPSLTTLKMHINYLIQTCKHNMKYSS